MKRHIVLNMKRHNILIILGSVGFLLVVFASPLIHLIDPVFAYIGTPLMAFGLLLGLVDYHIFRIHKYFSEKK